MYINTKKVHNAEYSSNGRRFEVNVIEGYDPYSNKPFLGTYIYFIEKRQLQNWYAGYSSVITTPRIILEVLSVMQSYDHSHIATNLEYNY